MAGPAAIELVPGLWRIPTAPWDLINSFLLVNRDSSLTLVDAGLAQAVPRLVAALRDLGYGPSAVSTIVLTHAHSDHYGGAAGLVRESGATVVAHAADAPFVRSGTLPPIDRSTRLGRLIRRSGPAPEAVREVGALHDGELLEEPGLRVHHTPGHSPGHCSLLHEASGVLITGDSIWNMMSRRTWPVLTFCTSAALNEQTAATLADLPYSTAAFTHGPEIRGTGRDAVRLFLAHPRRFGSWP